MATINITMTGDWIAVGEGGNVTVSPRIYAMEWATGRTKPDIVHGQTLRSYHATSFTMADGEILWLKGPANVAIAVDRDAPPS